MLNIQSAISHVCKSISNADNCISNLCPDVLSLNGMSSVRVRHLINNLCSFSDCCQYWS